MMPSELFSNNAQTNLAADITATQTTIKLTSGTGSIFPNPSTNQYFYITLTSQTAGLGNTEIVKVTSRSADTVTVVRGQQGTTARVWHAGDYASNFFTAGSAQNMGQDSQIQQSKFNYGGTDTGTANSYVITINPTPDSLTQAGCVYTFTASNANTGESTLTINGTSFPLKGRDRGVLGGNVIQARSLVCVAYDATVSGYVVVWSVGQSSTSTSLLSVAMTTSDVTLTTSQAVSQIIQVTGSGSNQNLIFPSAVGEWVVTNRRTSGTVTCKTASGSTVTISPNQSQLVYCDGANFLTGVNSVDTPAQFDYSTKLATTEFVQRALGNYRGIASSGGSATMNLTAGLAGYMVWANTAGGQTINLPAGSTMVDGAGYFIMAAEALTLKTTDGTNIFYSNANSGKELDLIQGDEVAIYWSAGFSQWFARTPAKLGLAGQFNVSPHAATTQFVQRALGNHAGHIQIGANTTLTWEQAGKVIQLIASNITVTLPDLTTAPIPGLEFSFYSNASSGITITTTSSQTFGDGTTSRTIGVKDSLILSEGGSIWNVLGGSVALQGSASQSSATFTTQALFDNTNKPATDAFVQKALGNRNGSFSVTSTTTLDSSKWGMLVELAVTASGQSVTFPSTSGIPGGAQIMIHNISAYDVTLYTGSSSQFISSYGNVTSLTCPAGAQMIITWDGQNFFVMGCYIPTPSRFDNTNKGASTAFVQQSLGNFSGYAAPFSGTLSASNCGQSIQVSGNVTLPNISTITPGSAIWLYSSGLSAFTVSVYNSSADFIYCIPAGWGTTTRSVTLPSGGWMILTNRGVEWDVVAGSMAQYNLALNGIPTATTAGQFDSSTKLATTEFVQRSSGSYRGVEGTAGGFTLTNSDIGQAIYLASGVTLTLPTPSSLGCTYGSAITVWAMGSICYLTPGTGATIRSVDGTYIPVGTNYSIGNGQFREFVAFNQGLWQEVANNQKPLNQIWSGSITSGTITIPYGINWLSAVLLETTNICTGDISIASLNINTTGNWYLDYGDSLDFIIGYSWNNSTRVLTINGVQRGNLVQLFGY